MLSTAQKIGRACRLPVGGASSSAKDESPRSLLSLPPELRLHIYEFVFSPEPTDCIPSRLAEYGRSPLNLLLTCRTINREIGDFGFRNATFHITGKKPRSLLSGWRISDSDSRSYRRAVQARLTELQKSIEFLRGSGKLTLVTRLAISGFAFDALWEVRRNKPGRCGYRPPVIPPRFFVDNLLPSVTHVFLEYHDYTRYAVVVEYAARQFSNLRVISGVVKQPANLDTERNTVENIENMIQRTFEWSRCPVQHYGMVNGVGCVGITPQYWDGHSMSDRPLFEDRKKLKEEDLVSLGLHHVHFAFGNELELATALNVPGLEDLCFAGNRVTQ